MGKKSGDKKRKVVDAEFESEEGLEESNDLQAEINAVLAIRSEKNSQISSDDAELNVQLSTKPEKERSTFNKEGLIKALESSSHERSLSFIESLEVCAYDVIINDENDDLEREMSFYNQSLLAVKEGRKKLEKLGVPTRRPTDYFCENVKTDDHMNRIKDRLLLEQKKIESFEKRKTRETDRKYVKQVSEMQSKKRKEDKENGKGKIGSKNEDWNNKSDEKESYSNRDRNKDTPEKSLKRRKMDKKYGTGIKEKMRAKIADKKSLNDLSDFNPKGGKFVRKDKVAAASYKRGRNGSSGGNKEGTPSFKRGRSGGGATKKGTNRPGKETRTNARKSRQSNQG